MYSDSIILRTVIQAGLTTKGSQLTAAELDSNFIALWQDLKERLSAGGLAEYNSGTTYELDDAVSFDSFTWLYVSLTPSSGTTPGSDEDVWIKVPVEYLAHQKNKDEYLAKGSADEVSANEIRTFIDSGGASANWFNTNLTATANRTHDAASFGSSVVNGSYWWLDCSDFAPSLGRASFEWEGYGTTSLDTLTRIKNGAGAVVWEAYGDKYQKAFGRYYFGGGYIDSAATDGGPGLKIVSPKSSFFIGWNEGEARLSGDLGPNSVDVFNTNASRQSYFRQNEGNFSWGFGKSGDNGSIKGNIGGSYTNTEIVSIKQTDGLFDFLLGKVKLTGIPTSSAGLATGTLWNDSGTIKIA